MKIIAIIRIWHKIKSGYIKYMVEKFHIKDELNDFYDKEFCYGARFLVESDTPQYFDIINYLDAKKINYDIARKLELSHEELNSFQYFEMGAEAIYDGSIKLNSDISEVCSYCHFGKSLKSQLQIPPSRLKKKKITFVTLLMSQDPFIIIPVEYIELFKDCSGITFEPILNSRNKEELKEFVHIKISNVLNKANKKTNFVPNGEDGCNHCNIPRVTLFDILYYDQKTLDKALDFNLTCEWIGGGRFPNRWIVVSQKVRQIILKNKLLRKGCFEPILSVPPF